MFTFSPEGPLDLMRVGGTPECGGEMCLIVLQVLVGVAALKAKMSLRTVFTPGLKRTLLFLHHPQRPERRVPSVLLSRDLTLAARENSRRGIPTPPRPNPDVPQRLVKASTLALGSQTSVTFPNPGPQPHLVPIFVDNSCSRALVRRPGNTHVDQHTDLGAHWSS